MSSYKRLLAVCLACLLLAVAAGLSLAASPASAPASAQSSELVTLHPSRDNTLYYHPDGATSNGLGVHVFAGHTNHGHERRILVAFDVAGAVPDQSTIVSATLGLNLSRTKAGPKSIALHRMAADWGEGTSNATENVGRGAQATVGDATWLQPFFGRDRMWRTAGGDFAGETSAVTIVDSVGAYTWGPTAEMASDVQSWLDAPDTSFGWMLLGDESAPRTTKRFDSKDHADEVVRPTLRIAYAPPAPVQELIYLPLAGRD